MATELDQNRVKVSNYLVPAVGGCSSAHIRYAGDFPDIDNAFKIDFRIFALDGEVFSPSGFFGTNYSTTNSVFIKISNGLVYEIPPGFSVGRQYPAPFDQIAEVFGLGDADIVFVNFPVIPFKDAPNGETAITALNGAIVSLGNTADAADTNPVDDNTLIAFTKGILSQLQGFDSTNANLPADFDSLAQTLNYTAGDLTSIVKTNGVNTWTQTFTYTAGNLTGISKWVKT